MPFSSSTFRRPGNFGSPIHEKSGRLTVWTDRTRQRRTPMDTPTGNGSTSGSKPYGLTPSCSWIMMRHVACILLPEWSTTSQRLWVYRISVPSAQNDPRFLFEKRRGQPREFWSLVSTKDGSTLPQDCVEEQLCS